MNKKLTIESLFNEVCELEVKHKLFEKQVDGVYIWKLVRFPLFFELAQKLNLYGNAHPGNKGKKVSQLHRFLERFKHALIHSPFRKKNYDTVIFTHPRKVAVSGTMKDIYSCYIEENLRSTGKEVLAIERPFAGKYLRPYSTDVAYSEPLSLYTFYLKLYYHTSSIFKKQLLKIQQDINTIAGIPVMTLNALSTTQIRSHLINFRNQYYYHSKIFKHIHPRTVYVLVSYGYEPMIAAAHDLGIPVTEIQHGTIIKQHIGYSYPTGVTVPYFPDKLLMWGKFWFDNSYLPIPAETGLYKRVHFSILQIYL